MESSILYKTQPNKNDTYFVIYTDYLDSLEVHYLIPVKYKSHFISYHEKDWEHMFRVYFNVKMALNYKEIKKICDIYDINLESLYEHIFEKQSHLHYQEPYDDIKYIDVREGLKEIKI